jgi:hypothetical protein
LRTRDPGAAERWGGKSGSAKADQAVSSGLAQAKTLAELARAGPLQPDKFHQALEAARVAGQLAESGGSR